MENRISSVTHLRGAGAYVDWPALADDRLQKVITAWEIDDSDDIKRELHIDRDRQDVRLVWSCAPALGVPHGPFTIWRREISRPTQKATVTTAGAGDEQHLRWDGTEAVCVEVTCEILDPNQPVGLFLLRGDGSGIDSALAADVHPPSRGPVTRPGGARQVNLIARCQGATSAILVNGRTTEVDLLPLEDAISGDDWEALEHVGLPISQRLRTYEQSDQGLVHHLTDPVTAALQRLERFGPPLGWWPLTETGARAPAWSRPDPGGLIAELHQHMFPHIERLYDEALPEFVQRYLVTEGPIEPPSQHGVSIDQDAQAKTSPLSTLLLAAGTDPTVTSALGFATAYRAEHLGGDPRNYEFLITANYWFDPNEHVRTDLSWWSRGASQQLVKERRAHDKPPFQFASYVPPAQPHSRLLPVDDLSGYRAALLPPDTRDQAHRESIELSFRPPQTMATMTGPVALALAGLDLSQPIEPAKTRARTLLGQRPGGGPQLKVVASPAPQRWNATQFSAPVVAHLQGATPPRAPAPRTDRPVVVDPELDLPLEGTVNRGYSLAQVNIFGIWSMWRDVGVTTEAPVVLAPRIGRLELTAQYEAATVCRSQLLAEVSVDWTERSPQTVELVALCYPMATGKTPPPDGAAPNAAAPPDAIRMQVGLNFDGDEPQFDGGPDAIRGEVVPLDQDGARAQPGPDAQGERGRSYRMTFEGPDLDFESVSRWGVQVWVRQQAPGISAPSSWSPIPDHPATAVAASPVPVLPEPPPALPGVPMGSTPDARNRSHVRITWAGLTSQQVQKVVIWEAAESTLFAHFGGETDRDGSPAERLEALRVLYTQAEYEQRPLGFRRFIEIDDHDQLTVEDEAVDLSLPKGSPDIHLFVVTAVTTTGLESPWPASWDHVQAFIAPKVLAPSMPVVRPALQQDNTMGLQIAAASAVPVERFEVFATRSLQAARNYLTMGPPVASLPVDSQDDLDNDLITADPIYTASASVDLPGAWEDWRIRVVAVPTMIVADQAVRGQLSVASNVLAVNVRPPGPHLEQLDDTLLDPARPDVLIQTSTTAPDRTVAAGSHTLVVQVGDDVTRSVALEDLRYLEELEFQDDLPSPIAEEFPVVARLPRSKGQTALHLWLTSPDAPEDLDVTVRLIDPLGRSIERTTTVDGWSPPPPSSGPELFLQLAGAERLEQGWIIEMTTNAAAREQPPYELVFQAIPSSDHTRPTPRPKPRPLEMKVRLPDIADHNTPNQRGGVPDEGAAMWASRRELRGRTIIALYIPLELLERLHVEIKHPEHGQAEMTWIPPEPGPRNPPEPFG